MDNPLKYYAELRDPHVERNREHLMEEILLIAIVAALCGAESWNDIADYGEDKREWLKTWFWREYMHGRSKVDGEVKTTRRVPHSRLQGQCGS